MAETLNSTQSAHRDIRVFLQQELVRRVRHNPRFSLRAFSRALGMDPSLLSKILNGKRRVSPTIFEQVVSVLGCSASEIALLSEGQSSQMLWSKGPIKNAAFRNLSMDEFQIISDWYHYAIFELVNVKNFRSSPGWMARVLNLSTEQVVGALRRMERVGLLQKNTKGKWTRTSLSITNVGNNISAAPFRALQKQILEKAIQVLEEVPLDKRNQTSMTMAIDPNLLPEAREVIARFRRDISAFLQKSPVCTEVYNLSISLYPVTQCQEVTPS